ncbi:hypothetical protein [Sinorhizobium numidicum]|uniref:hypothetical protein n=1 Tax=Sinorhizobium numidicum TaxID=680248 RepID=UPI00247561F4|nr:hypothetical protein [Sinorhizobium numidicum]
MNDLSGKTRRIRRRADPLVGGSERQVLVVVDPDHLEAYGLVFPPSWKQSEAKNQDRAAGTLISGINQRDHNGRGTIADTSGFNRIIVARSERLSRRPLGWGQFSTRALIGTSLANYQSITSLGLHILNTQGANTLEMASAPRREFL